MTGLPIELFTQSQSIVVPVEPDFLTSCDVCEENFLTKEQSANHFAGSDHETAHLFSISHLNNRVVEVDSRNRNQYVL